MTEAITDHIAKASPRTYAAITARLQALKGRDTFGFQSSDLLAYLPWECARQFLRTGAIEADWRAAYPVFKPPLTAVKENLPWAWQHANKSLGMSSYRTMEHLQAWFWLAGYTEEFVEECFGEYAYYGKPQLVLASKLVEYNWRAVDNGIWLKEAGSVPLTDAVMSSQVSKMITIAENNLKE